MVLGVGGHVGEWEASAVVEKKSALVKAGECVICNECASEDCDESQGVAVE